MKSYLVIIIIISTLLFIPFNLSISPKRSLTIKDINGNLIEGAVVRQVWYQYSLNIKGEEDFITNSNGIVNIPNRNVRTTIFNLVLGAFNNFRQYFINAGYTSHESIGVFANGYTEKWIHNPDGRQANIIIIDITSGFGSTEPHAETSN